MRDLFKLILGILASLLKSRAKLEAEILILRQQINVLRRRAPTRPYLNNTDRFPFFWHDHWCRTIFGAVAIARTETIIRWDRAQDGTGQVIKPDKRKTIGIVEIW